ncbi:Anaerobic sulfatase-maturating enzyme homolog AslB [Propionispora sp. 2/2-37]|uniref:anaerobic sulfatase maturase n=1 Tax=Propionispora sp. 2/2-37 TaxID=1677858 RepID=UPI0006BB6A18|nr:anaerobic sulfatase maturase [Propionispora sp. 2/2-37]CUH96029.1 Anaerobic sulfatase-maturating enzyme homolog AslB [Propionispora sp. 2/2-37]
MMRKYNSVHILAKPIGPVCNLNCQYCFYTEKKALYPKQEDYVISDKILETFIRKYIEAQSASEVPFVWQGGEPTLLGVEFFQRVAALQKKYAGEKKIVNSLQTNGTLLNEKWCDFLKEHDFLVGLSLDGPEKIHDRYRFACSGEPSFKNVMRGLELLQKYQVSFNVLSCVTKEASYEPLQIYQFFKKNGVKFIQFIPIVERLPDEKAVAMGLRHAAPTSPGAVASVQVAPWTVEAEAYGDFLIAVFDTWVRNDVGRIHVINFEWALESWLGLDSTICVFAKQCGAALVMEHDGAVYSCDHFVYPAYELGNILTSEPDDLVQSQKQWQFSLAKKEGLPDYCKVCEAEFACHGECPKHRFLETPDGEEGLNYLCAGYKKYLRHIHPYMKVMRQLIENSLPPAKVMDVIRGPLIVKH